MPFPTYTNFVPPAIDAGNLNEINGVVYGLLGNGTDVPTNDLDIRNNIGLGTMATQNAGAVAITGGSVTGITDITVADGGTGASTAAAARTNLGVAQIGPTFSAKRIAAQAIGDAVQTTVIFTNEDWDTDNAYNNVTGIFNPQVAGYYHLSSNIILLNSATNVTNGQIAIFKNGVSYKRGSLWFGNTGTTQAVGLTVSGVVFFNGTTDTAHISAFLDFSAGTGTIEGTAGGFETWFDAHFIRP